MELLTIDVPVQSTSTPILLVPISDVHVGARDFDRAGFKQFVAAIASSPHRIVPFILGDVGEHISFKDKRFSATGVDPSYPVGALSDLSHAQCKDFLGLIEPIKDRIAWVTKGNHETAVERSGVFDPHSWLLGKLPGAKDGQYSGLVRIRIVRDKEVRTYKVFYHHGWFGGSQGNKVNKLIATAQTYPVDLVIVGHGHEPAVAYMPRVQTDQRWTQVSHRSVLGLMVPTWKTGHGNGFVTWEETKGFTPKLTGACVVRVDPVSGEGVPLFGDAALEALR